MPELGTGWVSIVPSMKGFSSEVSRELNGMEPEFAKAGDKNGQTMGSRLMGAAGKTMKVAGVAAGAAAGGAITVGITKGIGRLNAIEQAESKLSGLGNSGQQVGSIMDDALSSVKGTAYGLGDAATVAAAAVAAGVEPGEDLERTLKLVGDSAAIAGSDLSEMGSIFNKVATSGKVQGDVLNQLSDQGIPIVQLLAEELGVAADEVYKLGRDGEIGFDVFRNAIETGMGGAALEAGNTAQGAMANVGAAAGRLGATLAGPFFEQSQGAFVGITTAIDEMTDRAAPAMEEFSDWMTGVGIPAVKDFAGQAVESFQELAANPALQSAFRSTQIAIGNVVDAGKALAPVMLDIGQTVAQAAAAVGVSAWDLFATGLGAAATVAETLAGPLEFVADLMGDHPGLVAAGIAAWTGFRTVPRMLTGVATGIAGITGASAALDGVSNPIRKIGTALSPIRDQAVLVGSSVREAGVQVKGFAAHQPGVGRMSATMQALGNNVPAIQRMNQAYASSSAGLKTFAANQRIAGSVAQASAMQSKNLFTTVDRMGAGAFRNATGAVSSFAGTVTGVGAAGLSGMKSAASGVMDLMGGPWGAALAVGAGAVMMVADWQAKWNTYLDESENLSRISTRSYKSMFDAIVDGASRLDTTTGQVEDLRESLTKVGESDPGGISRWFKEIQLNVEEFGNSIRTEAASAATAKEREWLDAADAAEKAAAALDELGYSNEEVAKRVNGSAAEFRKFKQEIRETEEGGEQLAVHMQELRDANEKAAESAERLGPAVSGAASLIAELGEKSAVTEDDIVKLNRAMAGLRGESIEAGEATGELTAALTDANEAQYEFGQVTLDSAGFVDQGTQAGVDFYDALTSVTDAYLQSAIAGNDAGEEFARIEDTLYAMGDAAGLSQGDMDDLLSSMNLMPNQVYTQVSLDGDVAKSELYAIGQQLAGIEGDGPHEAEISVTDEAALEALENAGFKLKEWDEETGVGTLKVADDQAMDRFTWWTEHGFPAIDMAEPTAEANLDTSGLGFNAHYAQMQLDTIDQERPTPLADMDVSQFTQKQIKMLNDVGLLDGKEPTPDASMNISALDEHQKAALAMVVDLSGKEAVPIAKLMGLTKFYEDTEDAKRYLNSIPDSKTVTVHWAQGTVTVEDPTKLSDSDSYFPTPAPNPQGAFDRANGRADGGRLPKNARGSRLPTSGPGTDRKDGILGVSADGTPMSWVDAGEWIINSDSSEKYDSLLAAINADDVDAIGAALPENAGGGRAGGVSGGAQLSMGMDLEGILAEQAQGSTFDPLTQSWEAMAQGMQDAESSLVAPALANVQANVGATGEMFTSTVTGVVNPMVQSMGDHLTAVKTGLMDPAMAGIRDGMDLTGQWTTNAVQSVMNPQWSSMGSHLQAVKDGSVLPTFGGIQSGIDTLAGWFSTGVGNMGDAFGRLRPGTGGPGAFVVREVFNNGIRGAWNAIAELIDEKQMGTVPMGALGGYATGGVLPGYTPGRDVHQFSSPTGGRLMLSGGEAIMRPEWTRAVGGPRAVEQMNAAARNGNLQRVPETDEYVHAHALGGVMRFANGGVLSGANEVTTDIQRSMMHALAGAFPNAHISSGTRYADVGSGYDNHMAGRALDLTGPMPQIARWIYQNYKNSAELIHWPLAGWQNLKNGAPLDYGPATNAGHADHVHWAMSHMVDPVSGKIVSMAGPGDGGAMVSITEMVKQQWDDELDKIPKWGGGHGMFGAAAPKLQESMAAKAWKYVEAQADKIMAGPATPGGSGVDRWRPMVRKAFSFQNEPFVQDHFERLMQQMQNESNGDPNVMQHGYVDINTGGNEAVGLFQFAKGTWPGYRDPRLADDRRDPWANINAGVRYARDRHGWGPIVGSPGGWKDGGVLPSDLPAALFDQGGYLDHGTAAVNQSGRPEPVFTASQWDVLKQSIASTTAMVDPIRRWVNGGQLDHMAESLDVVAEELSVAYRGGDWGYGELASYIGEERARWAVNEAAWVGNTVEEIKAAWNGKDFGLAGVARYLGGNEKLAARTLDVVESIGRGVRGVQTGIANFTAGVQKWAAADEDRGRMGTPEELAVHFGGMAAKEFASDALSLVGLDGLADIRFSESFVDLVNEASDAIDDVWGVRLGHITQDSAQPMSVLDDDLRNPNTVVKPVEEETPAERAEDEQDEAVEAVDVEPATVEVEPLTVETPNEDEGDEPEGDLDTGIDPLVEPLAEEESAPVATATAETSQVSITLQGDAYSADEVERMLSQINESVDGIDVRVERLERAQLASVVAGVR